MTDLLLYVSLHPVHCGAPGCLKRVSDLLRLQTVVSSHVSARN